MAIEQLMQLVFGIDGKGRASGSGGGQWMIKCAEAMREMQGRAHLTWEKAERR